VSWRKNISQIWVKKNAASLDGGNLKEIQHMEDLDIDVRII
jgi:hypothetical protein